MDDRECVREWRGEKGKEKKREERERQSGEERKVKREREIQRKKPQTDMLVFYPNYIHISWKACRCILPLKHDDFEFYPKEISFQCVFFFPNNELLKY